MEVYDSRRPTRGAGHAGLVLLYAPDYDKFQPAYPLESHEVVIGREAPASVVVPQPAVSRSHARINYDGSGWVLTDLGARNGTLVNGMFVSQAHINHGDELRIGDAFFKFVERDCEGYLNYRIDGAVLRGAPACPSGMVGGYQMATITTALEKIAQTPISVIILGESGTGKEVFARAVHTWSGRPGAFCALNCAAIPANLLESELFGYRRGAFSGAERDHVGLVRAADHGTLFLDEVGDMPLAAQAKLLRVLQAKEVLPLGATQPEQVDVRVVCATHRDLNAMQTEKTFRGDLFARINEYSVQLPALRDRKEDIYALCIEFLRQQKRPDLIPSVPYMTGVLHYEFPYNVRELEALIKRGIALCDSDHLSANHLSAEIHTQMRDYGRRQGQHGEPGSRRQARTPQQPAPSWQPPPSFDSGDGSSSGAPASHTDAAAIPQAVASYVPLEAELRSLLQQTRGNVAAVGRHYGKERMQVHRWMKRYAIDPNDYR